MSTEAIKESKLSTKSKEKQFKLKDVYRAVKGLNKNLSYMNPEEETKRDFFLSDSKKAEQRESLKSEVNFLIDVLEENPELTELLEICRTKEKEIDECIKQNQETILNRIKKLETNYRALSSFYSNSKKDEIDNFSLINATLEQVTYSDGNDSNKLKVLISRVLRQGFDRFNLHENFSLMVIPGYLGDYGANIREVIKSYGEIAHKHQVSLITDFLPTRSFEELKNETEKPLVGSEGYKSHIIMTANWLISREKHEKLGEYNEPLMPSSAGLAGKIKDLLSQPSGGFKYGNIKGSKGASYSLLKSETADLVEKGLVPFIYEDEIYAFGAGTLYNGEGLDLQTYSVVRTFDYLAKVMSHYLSQKTLENITPRMRKDMESHLANFLVKISGDGSKKGDIIEEGKVLSVTVDPKQKDKVDIQLSIKPFFPAKSFTFELTGQAGTDDLEVKAK